MRNQDGNILYYIFFAIALIAALSIAVSRGGRGSVKSLNEDRQKLLASEIISFGDTAAKAVAQLRLRGTAFSALSFASPDLPAGYGVYGAAPANEIFNPAGGAVTYKPPAPDALDGAGGYVFTASNEVSRVGTTCAGDGCTDLLLLAGPLRGEVCMRINDLLDVDNPSGAPPVDSAVDTTPFASGATAYVATLGDDAGAAPLQGRTAACFQEDAGDRYYFYQVLVPR